MGERLKVSRTALGGKVDDFCDVAVSLNELARVQTRGDWAAFLLSLCPFIAEPSTSQNRSSRKHQ